MDPLPTQHLISTKEASKVSGYHGDYLSRLARTGKIEGRRLGRNWLIDPKSLDTFLKQQRVHKIVSAQTLARLRTSEYRKNTDEQSLANYSDRFTTSLGVRTGVSAFASQASAAVVAILIVGGAALVAESSYVPAIAAGLGSSAQNFSSGFGSTFGAMPARIISELLSMRRNIAHQASDADVRSSKILTLTSLTAVQVNEIAARANGYIRGPAFSAPVYVSYAQSEVRSRQTVEIPNLRNSTIGDAWRGRETAMEVFQKRIRAAYEVMSSPTRLSLSIRSGYQSMLTRARAVAIEPRAMYRSLVQKSHGALFSLGASAREWLSNAPQFVNDMNLALGFSVIRAAHAAIGAEVALAYMPSTAAPASARVVVAFVGNVGDALERTTSRVPSLAVKIFLKATELPSIVAPRIAEAVFWEEYAAASRFISVTDTVKEQYALAVNSLGHSAYAAARGAIALASIKQTSPDHVTKPAPLSAGTALGERLPPAMQPQVAAVASAIRALPSASVAATTTPGEGSPPIIRLTGPAALLIATGDVFKDPGATAFDPEDGNLSTQVVASGVVDTEVPGLYTITYTASDSAHNVSSVSRVVSVVSPQQTVSPVGSRRSVNSADPFAATW